MGQSHTVGQVSRKLGITEQTYYRWRKEYGGMRVEQAKRLKEAEKENFFRTALSPQPYTPSSCIASV